MIEDYNEVFGGLPSADVPDADGDGIIAALDNDDNNDSVHDGSLLDDDHDGIPNYLEIYGFIYTGDYHLWSGNITQNYFKTNPRFNSTDHDQYPDDMEVTGIDMDPTVVHPGDNPMITAFPNLKIALMDYTIKINGTITETNGTQHTSTSTWYTSFEESTSVTDEWNWNVGGEVTGSFTEIFSSSFSVSHGESHSTTYTKGTARSIGGEMSDATAWSRAVCTDPSHAADMTLTFQIKNVGTCFAQNVRFYLTLKIGDKAIKTFYLPVDPIQSIPAGSFTPDLVSMDISLTSDDLRALRTGGLVSYDVLSIEADVIRLQGSTYIRVDDWYPYFIAAKNESAHLYLDLGNGNTTEHLVYAGAEYYEPKVTLGDALIWAANGHMTDDGPSVRFYQPGGALGAAAPLDDWYFSLDAKTYESISSYISHPEGFNFFNTILKAGSVIVAKAPPVDPTPKIHWAMIKPLVENDPPSLLDGKVTAFVDDYFFPQSKLKVSFIDKFGTWHNMTWDPVGLCFYYDIPDNYFRSGTERISAKNLMYDNTKDPRHLNYRSIMTAAAMTYIPPYAIVGSCTAGFANRDVFVQGNFAYVASDVGLSVVNVTNPQNPQLVGSWSFEGMPVEAVYVQGSYAYVVVEETGFYVVDVSDPANPIDVYSYDSIWTGRGVYVADGFAYVAAGDGLYAFNLSNPANPTFLSKLSTAGGNAVYVQDTYAYVAAGLNGLKVIDVSDPAAMKLVGSCETPDRAGAVHISGSYAYVADGLSGLQVIDISNPALPVIAGAVHTPGSALDVYADSEFAYVADYSVGVQVIDATNPTSPKIVRTIPTPVYPSAVHLAGTSTYRVFLYEVDYNWLNVLAVK